MCRIRIIALAVLAMFFSMCAPADFPQLLPGVLAAGDQAASAASEPEEVPAVPVIRVITGFKPPFARGPGFARVKPKTFEAAEALAEAVGDKAAEKIGEQVDFRHEFLVFFQWAGSGQDKLSFEIDQQAETPKVVFKFRPGRTRDLRPHAYLYAIRKGVSWEIGRRSQPPRRPGAGRLQKTPRGT